MTNVEKLDALRPRIAAEGWTILDPPGVEPAQYRAHVITWGDGVEVLDWNGYTSRVDDCLDATKWSDMAAMRIVAVPTL